MFTLLQIELYKIIKRPRTYIAFAAIAALVFIIQLGLKLDGKSYVDFLTKDFSFQFEGNILNGYLVCFIILQLLLIHVPLLIALIAADMISGEANMGTLRLLLTKPISRTQLVLSKFFASTIYTLSLLLWMALLALLLSMFIFGTDSMVYMKSSYIVIIEHSDIFWRYLAAFCFAALAMTTVASIGFFLSIFAENSIGPIVATMSIIIVFTILSTLDIPIFNIIKPYLFTTHMVTWREFFDLKVNAQNVTITGSVANWKAILNSAIVLMVHIIGLVYASIVVLRKKDILS
jgi:ABC-2 type transport system permease protein